MSMVYAENMFPLLPGSLDVVIVVAAIGLAYWINYRLGNKKSRPFGSGH